MLARNVLLLSASVLLAQALPIWNGGSDAANDGQMHIMNDAVVNNFGGANGAEAHSGLKPFQPPQTFDGQNSPAVLYAPVPGGAPGGGVVGPQATPQYKLQKYREILQRYAPDSWLSAWDAIPENTKLCLINSQAQAMRAIQHQQADPQTAMQQAQQQCMAQGGQAQVEAFGKAVEASFNQLPDKFKNIFKTACDSIKAAQSQIQQGNVQPVFDALSKALESLKALTAQDREDIANVFPKLRNVITASEISDIFDGGDKIVLGLAQIVKAIQALGAKL